MTARSVNRVPPDLRVPGRATAGARHAARLGRVPAEPREARLRRRRGSADKVGMTARSLLMMAMLLAVPSMAVATAGFAERHAQLRYTSGAALTWTHPGDGCECGKYCFRLHREKRSYATYPGMERTFEVVSVPDRSTGSWMLARRCGDASWLLYDLAREQVVFESPDSVAAVAAWRAQGLPAPRFADARTGAHGLHETWASRFEDVAFLALMFLPGVILSGSVVSALLFPFALWRGLRSRAARDYTIAAILLLGAAPAAWFAWVLATSMRASGSH